MLFRTRYSFFLPFFFKLVWGFLNANCVMIMLGRVMIVTQYMPRGSLEQLLKSNTPLAFDERLRMAKDIALGLSWLHNISKIVHR